MRRAKGDLMKSAINSYLKRRRFTEFEQNCKTESTLPINSSQQMAIMGVVDKELSRTNSITYSSIANDTGQVEYQFTRLKNWIADLKTENYRFELAALLSPLFCHLYLDMLCGSHRQSATKFFKRHQALFASRENSRELLEELTCVSNSQDIEMKPYVKSFRSAKYHLKVSTEAMMALQNYLSDNGHLLILQTMQKWFDVEIMQNIKIEKEDGTGGDGKQDGKKDDEFAELLSVIKEVREKPIAPSPLLLYVISNVNQNSRVHCTKIDETVSLLGAGMNTSIKIWGLSGKISNHRKSSSITIQTKQLDPEADCETQSQEKLAVTLYGHSGPVQDIAFVQSSTSPGVLVSVSQDATLRSWRLDTFECAAAYGGHNREIWCVDVSSLGIFVVTGSSDRTARVWSLERNYPLRTCAGHLLDVECIKFHPNNLYFATGSADKTVRMWSVNDAKLLRLFFGHRGAIQALSFSPDGKFLASAADDRRIKIWDLAAGKILKEFKGHTNAVISLSWDRTNDYLSSCSVDGTVRLWSLQNKGNSSDNPSNDLLRTYTIGSGLLSVQYSKSNTLVCVAVS